MGSKELTRGAGVLLAITSLPSSYGIGTLGEAAFQFVDLLVDLKQRYWQVLPIGPTSFGNSPYQSYSAFAGNPYLIDLDDLVKDGLLQETEIRSFNWGTDDADIDYATIYENRYKILRMAFSRFSAESEDFLAFTEKSDRWLSDYSLYTALKRHFGDIEWQSWDVPLRDRDQEAVKEYQEILHNDIMFCKFCQYEFFKQWMQLKQYANSRGVQIIGDMPLYVASDSVDVWAHREMFLLGPDGRPNVVAGAAPDAFSESGQVWGSPVYDWNVMEEDGFAWWKARMLENMELFDVIRLDHFSGLVRYYTVSADAEDGRNGKWSKGPGRKLTDAMTEVLGDTRVIVEDIGPKGGLPGVKKLKTKTGWPGIKILMFAFDDDTANEHLPHNYQDTNMVVYAGTHDNETIVGYFRDKSDYELAYLYEYLNIHYKEEIPDALIRAAYASIADVAIIQMQDLMKLGNEARMNAPSTVGRNWRWRIGKDENKRAPMYWSTDADATGMCDGSKDMDEVKMKYGSLKEQENDGNSIYNFVKQTIALRNEYPVIARGKVAFDEGISDDTVCVIRKTCDEGQLTLVFNTSEKAQTVDFRKSALGATEDRKYPLQIAGELLTGTEAAVLDEEQLTIPAYSVVILE